MNTLERRLRHLEKTKGRDPTELPIVGSVTIPESDKPVTPAVVKRWIAEGLARVAFDGHAICYDGGQTGDLTMDEWLARYAAPPELTG